MKMDQQTQWVEIVVETPRGDGNIYEWDAKAQVIRLSGVRYNAEPHPFERGHIAHSLSTYGEPLSALLAISLPTFAGCVVRARVIGALERGGETTEDIIVAAALNDARLAQVNDYADLDDAARMYLEAELSAGARWLDAEAAFQIAHAARQRWALTRGDGAAQRIVSAWKADEQEALRMDERGMARHSRAEARLYTLPLRFQNYVASLLAPDERILLWVHRPRVSRARLGIFGREILRQGLLVITNQQCLWMMDPVTPPHIVAGYGYVARAVALERLKQARLEENTPLRIVIELATARGAVESFAIEFPDSARDDLVQAVRVLNAFVPREDDRRIMRQFDFQPRTRELQDPTTSDAESTRALLQRLRDARASELNGETVYAEAFIPEWGGAQLLTVTNRHLHYTPDPAARKSARKIPLDTIGSVELCNSQLGSWFRVWLPSRANLDKWEISFPIVFASAFSEIALALRVLSAAPAQKFDQAHAMAIR
jgi:inorganic pyrophosphatase